MTSGNTKAGATHDKFIELGFTQVIIQQRPDDRFYIVSGPNAAGEYDSTPRDLKQLKANFSAEQLVTANGILQQSDFVFIRLAEEVQALSRCPLLCLRSATRCAQSARTTWA